MLKLVCIREGGMPEAVGRPMEEAAVGERAIENFPRERDRKED